ncbi:ectonucleoside triphosphate diphosphohydrolase 7-like [Babylonia areolata]|uniref:ectonucleoside triphosphate diphosphohydrolase 7-like n=1 Tax=Babylonia areolata TaxID=304850 RepID=UPI003FD40B6A
MARIYLSPCLTMKGDKTKKLTWIVLMAVITLSFLTLVISALLSATVFRARARGFERPGQEEVFRDLHYGIVIDCGSSGSRVYVYFWPPHSGNPHDLLNIQQLMDHEGKPVAKKVSPGLSSFEDHPDEASDHIKKLLLFAQDYIPREKHKETPLYILATAGMRMIPKIAQDKIMKDLHTDIPQEFDFVVAENHFEIIPGKLEGVYAWIAVNYALDRFSHSNSKVASVDVQLPDGKTHRRSQTVGMIDMGGGSVQIAYEVTDESQLKQIPRELIAEFNLGCQETDIEHTYRVYVTTFLGYGANSAIDRYQDSLVKDVAVTKPRYLKKNKPVYDPCLPSGMPLLTKTEEGTEQNFVGTGRFSECKTLMEPLLNLTVACTRSPCSFNGVHQPPIDFSNTRFYGFSEFWYTMEDVYGIGGHYDYKTFERNAKEFCSTSWSQLEWRYKHNLYPKADDHRFKYECIKSAWLTVVLHKGFQFPENFDQFDSAQLIEGKDVQWTLGALIYRTRFLPLRDLNHGVQPVASPWSKYHFFNEYLIILCFIIVLAAIFLYMKRLKMCPKRASMTRVPTMSYFMTEEGQMEEGVRYVRDQGYL